MSFKERLKSGKFLVTSEIGPPKGISLNKVLEEMLPVKEKIDAVNVTDLQSSILRMSALGASILLKQHGFEPIFQVTCRDRNRLALQSDILSAAAFGIENILALTGDHPSLGDHPEAKPVFDLDAISLVEVLRNLERGYDMNHNKLLGPPLKFCVGAAVNPGADPLEPEIIKMEKKLAAGAEFFQTQAIFDVRVLEKFLKAAKHLKTKILAGIVLLRSERMAKYLNEHVPGISVPTDIADEMSRASDKREACVRISARLIRQIKPFCQGVHLMPIGWYSVVPSVLEAL